MYAADFRDPSGLAIESFDSWKFWMAPCVNDYKMNSSFFFEKKVYKNNI